MDVLRRRRSVAWMMDDGSDRAAVLGALAFVWGWPAERIAVAAEETHGPGPLTDAERARLAAPLDLATAPPPVRGDYPDWIDPHMNRVFGEARAEEGAALAARAPLDVRVNTLKTDLVRALKALAPFDPEAPGTSSRTPSGFPRPTPASARRRWRPRRSSSAAGLRSRISAVSGPRRWPARSRAARCSTSAPAAAARPWPWPRRWPTPAQLYAYDSDARRLTDTVRRSQRAGVRNLQVRSPIHPNALAGLQERMDLVFVDAPCTGSGTWRRHPDTKWRVTPEQLARMAEQDAVLSEAAAFVKPGGRIVYVTCSLFAEESEDRVASFVEEHPDFALDEQRRLTPRGAGTDGFYAAILQRGARPEVETPAILP